MRGLSYNAKSVSHEACNGILLCPGHREAFSCYFFYIKWNSEVRFQPAEYMHNLTFMTLSPTSSYHSQAPDYETIHGSLLHFTTDMM